MSRHLKKLEGQQMPCTVTVLGLQRNVTSS
jgi:hypothetical protein